MKKILFIEDDPSLRKTFADYLKKEGYSVLTARDGLEGLKKVQEEEPNLVLVDLILPKMEGLSVLEKIKEKKDIPVIVLTNLEDSEKIEKAIEKGAAAYLIKKDYSLKDLLEKIKENL